MQSRRPTVSGSLGSDSRWPHFGGRVARMGVHSALALPLLIGDQVIGAINSYAYRRDAFGEHAVELGSQFAGPAAVSVYNAQLLDRCPGADGTVAAGVGQPGGDRSGDRDHPQPVGRQRGGGLRSADPDQPVRERQAASWSPSGWWRRRCGAHGRGSVPNALAAWRIRRWRRPVPGGHADRSSAAGTPR